MNGILISIGALQNALAADPLEPAPEPRGLRRVPAALLVLLAVQLLALGAWAVCVMSYAGWI